jgi:CheY-like chemotaxis protein
MSRTNRADIVIVEDNATVAQFLAEVLDEVGYTTRRFGDGLSARVAISADVPALVLLDVDIPGLHGTELLALLRRGGFPDLPIVMITASTVGAGLVAQGATEVLTKPFDLDELLACVAHYVVPESPTTNERSKRQRIAVARAARGLMVGSVLRYTPVLARMLALYRTDEINDVRRWSDVTDDCAWQPGPMQRHARAYRTPAPAGQWGGA